MNLIGVFPESQVTMPKINPIQKYPNQLTNGHTHLFMMCGKTNPWGSEAKLKNTLAKVLAKGDRETMRIQKGTGIPTKLYNTDPPCKIVYIVLGDSPVNEWIEDVKLVKLYLLGCCSKPTCYPCKRFTNGQCIHRSFGRKGQNAQ